MTEKFKESARWQSGLLGTFILTWGAIEATLEVSIAKLLGLDPYTGSIVTSNMMFKNRCEILRALLVVQEKNSDKAISCIKELLNFPERNAFVHGIITRCDDYIVVTYRRPGINGLTAKIRKYSWNELVEFANKTADLYERTQVALGVSPGDLSEYLAEVERKSREIAAA